MLFVGATTACGADVEGRPTLAPDPTTNSDAASSPGETSESEVTSPESADGLDPSQSENDGGGADSNTAADGVDGGAAAVTLGSSNLVGKKYVNIAGRKVGVIASTASVGPEGHIVDVLNADPDVEVVAVFSPEHGFRSDRPSGAEVGDEIDPGTGLPVFSLYGDTYIPTAEMLDGIDILVYDLQDVGTRYYTYISTLGLVMQAASEHGVEVMVLDRPNPNGGLLTSGVVADAGNTSLVSKYPVPSMYGLTVGELATAIVAEGWIDGMDGLDLTVVPMEGWQREHVWADTGLPWVAPSPGLPTAESARVYPSVVLFEATTLSYGQGTDRPFHQIGAPWLDSQRMVDELNEAGLDDVSFVATTFTPQPTLSAPEPRYVGEAIPGVRLEVTGQGFAPSLVGLHLLAAAQRQAPEPIIDRGPMFDLLAGGGEVRRQLREGVSPEQIVDSWRVGLDEFDDVRNRYLLYPSG